MVKAVEKQNAAQSSVSGEPIMLPDFDAKIAELAYYKAESRNFEPGFEVDDWLAAEQEFLQSSLSY